MSKIEPLKIFPYTGKNVPAGEMELLNKLNEVIEVVNGLNEWTEDNPFSIPRKTLERLGDTNKDSEWCDCDSCDSIKQAAISEKRERLELELNALNPGYEMINRYDAIKIVRGQDE